MGKWNKSQGISGKRITCNFFLSGSIVGQTLSLPINVDISVLDNCPVQIKCPTPPSLAVLSGGGDNGNGYGWDEVSVGRDPAPLESTGIALFSNETERFPACHLPAYSPSMEAGSRKFELAMCAYMFSSDTDNLVEWMEYHLLLGVDHFFIYNTATTDTAQARLREQLRPYTSRGKVTLVDWPYMNCVRNMGTGRYIYFYEPTANGRYTREQYKTHHKTFKPPKKIMQSSAIGLS
jgi:hypothetical protein